MTDSDHTSRAAQPPRAAVRLLQTLLPADERGEALLGDLIEEFHATRAPRLGAARARRWFWRETLVAVSTFAAPRRRHAPRDSADGAPRTGDSLVVTFLADLRHAARLLRRAPGFVLLVTLTLGLGIGATTAIFSLVNPVLLRALPYPRPDRLVAVWERDADGQRSNTGFATFADVAARTRTLERIAAFGDWQPTISGDDFAERLAGQRVSWTYFGALGVRPAIGRDFVAGDDAPGANHVVVLGHGVWARRFGGDSSIVGRAIPIDGVPHVVVGVLPADFDDVLAPDVQVWRVLGYDASQAWACRTCRSLRVVARLRDGVSREAAAAELNALSAALVREHPADYPRAGALVVPLQEEVTRAFRPILFAVVGAAALVLMIAAANVANLQLARAMRRDSEFAVRAALGAGTGRLLRQLLAEGLLLAALGGVAGVAVARVALPALVARLPETLPRLSAVRLDLAALAVATAATLVLGVIAGLVPAWHGGRSGVFDTLRGAASGRLAGAGRHVARAGMVVSEVALALMLLSGAALLSRSLVRLMSVDVGFDASHLLTLQAQATGPRYADDRAVFANHDRVREAVRAVPGVVGVGVASQLPLGGNVDAFGVAAEDRPLANPELAPSADRYAVSPDFMATMRIRMLRGRGFTEADGRDSTATPVAIVSAALAARIWPGEDAVGKRIRIGGPTRPWLTVVGVAGNVRHSGLDAAVTHQVYVPERQWEWAENQVALVVRTAAGIDAASVAPAVRSAVQSVDPSQPVTHLATMDQVVAASTAQRRLALLLFAAFAGAAIVLAAAGIYGVLAGSVAERTREIGLRSALGATPRDIALLVLTQGARLAAAGVAIGIAGALGLGRFIAGLLYDVRPTDPLTLVAVAAALGVVAVAACWLPARRALRVEPMEALRAE